MLMMQPLRRLMVKVRGGYAMSKRPAVASSISKALHALLPLRLAPALAALQGQQLIAFALASAGLWPVACGLWPQARP